MKWVLCSLLWFLALTGATAQVGFDGTILGVVTDARAGVVAGATVTITNLDTGIQKVEVSRQDGSFEITALPAGRWSRCHGWFHISLVISATFRRYADE